MNKTKEVNMQFETFKYLITKKFQYEESIETIKYLILTERGLIPGSFSWSQIGFAIDHYIEAGLNKRELSDDDNIKLKKVSRNLLDKMVGYAKELEVVEKNLPKQREIERMLTIKTETFEKKVCEVFQKENISAKFYANNYYELNVEIVDSGCKRMYTLDARQYWFYNKFGTEDYTYGVIMNNKLLKSIGVDYPMMVRLFWEIIRDRGKDYYKNLITKCATEIEKKKKEQKDLEDFEVIIKKQKKLQVEIDELQKTIDEKTNYTDWD